MHKQRSTNKPFVRLLPFPSYGPFDEKHLVYGAYTSAFILYAFPPVFLAFYERPATARTSR